jgi:energy-coupling factor transport system ATP-binding protein
MSSDPALRLSHVGFTYRGAATPALDGVDLTVQRGEMAVVLGPSGAGKTTLCLCTNGLIPHFVHGSVSGRVEVFGVPTTDGTVSQLARDVALVFQDFEAQLFSTSVELEVAFGPENFAVPPDEIRRRVAGALAAVGLAGFERREPATLSGGEKQRLAIASVLSLQPGILVMDEPTTDLDPLGKESVFEIGRRLRRAGATLLVVEHETEEATGADRVIVLDDGRIVAEGAPSEVLARGAWLEQAGVRPPGAAHLLGMLGEEPVLDEQEAVTRLRALGYGVSASALETMQRRDAARSAAYGEPVVEVQALVHRYEGGMEALRGVDLTIRRGEFVALLGQNGSGKTTLVKHFNGLLQPTIGEVRVVGGSTRGQSVSRLGRLVGYVFQNPDHQIFAETVFEEVAFGPRNHGVPAEQTRARVTEALAAVGMTGRETDDPFVLTKGERQRVAVASVLATQPQLIVLDEPTTGLDYREQRQMMDLVRRLNERGHTIVCVTHSMWVAAEYAHRVVVMKDGRVWMDGTAREVFAREGDLAAARLRPAQMVRVTNRLGGTLLDRREVVEVLGQRATRALDQTQP